MANPFKAFFDKYVAPAAPADNGGERLRLAAAALLAEVMRMDSEVKDEERNAIEASLRDSFSLSAEQAAELTVLAERSGRQAHDYYQFTSEINRSFDLVQRIALVENLWRVAYADDQLSRYEDHLIRKISDLLYVPHRDFIAAKLRARGAQD